LIDPIDQRQRFEEQARQKAGGDEEALPMDEDYLLCMEHGLPPVSGWGMGIDRVVCLLTDQDNLREAILFPLMKPKAMDQPPEE
jgi:lysyl-tRNA synthetase class 2